MTTPACHQFHPATAALEAALYQPYTFPAYRYLLDPASAPAGLLAIGLRHQGVPVGLALGYLDAPDAALLASLYLKPEQRHGGLARQLLQSWMEAAQAAGAQRLHATWRSGQASTAALENLLLKAGWSPPQARMLVIEATLSSIAPAPWMQPRPLPAGFRIVAWQSLSAAQRRALHASHDASPWIAPELLPWTHETGCEAHTSLALLHEEAVIGWVINHVVAGVLRFTCSFIHPRQQGLARITLLYRESVLRAAAAGFTQAMWTVPRNFPRMVRFAERWMAPYTTHFDETRGSDCKLRR